MKFRPLFPLTLCLASSAVLVGVYAQGAKKTAPNSVPPATASSTGPDKSQDGVVIVNGDTSISDDSTGISKLTKNVTVTQIGQDFILYCQSLTYNRFKDRAVATDDLRIETRDSTVRGARVDADFNTKMLILTGSVVIATHGKGDGITGNHPDSIRSQATQKASKIACDRVDWDYETHQAVLTGNIHFTQGKATGTCDRILFDERQNVAELQGNVRFTDENGRVVHTPNLTIYMDENSMRSGGVKLWIPQPQTPGATPLPTKAPVSVKKGPKISDNDLKIFDVTPPPIPTAQPEATEEPVVAPTPPAPASSGG